MIVNALFTLTNLNVLDNMENITIQLDLIDSMMN